MLANPAAVVEPSHAPPVGRSRHVVRWWTFPTPLSAGAAELQPLGAQGSLCIRPTQIHSHSQPGSSWELSPLSSAVWA